VPETQTRTAKRYAELTGTVRRIVFHDHDSGTLVAQVKTDQHIEKTVRGPAALDELPTGAYVRFLGNWYDHPKYGEQFAFTAFARVAPLGRDGVIRYLMDLAPGVGKVTATKLWEAFQGDAERVLRQEPERVVEAGIMGKDAAAEASQALADESAWVDTKIDLLDLLAGRGFGNGLIATLIKEWGHKAPGIVRANPFRLMLEEFHGCGFMRCDKLYLDLGHPRDRRKRAALFAWDHVSRARGGHTWHDLYSLGEAIADNCKGPDLVVTDVFRLGIAAKLFSRVKLDEGRLWIARAKDAQHEYVVSECVKDLLAWPTCRWPKALPPGKVSRHQNDVLTPLLKHPLFILAGTPGTGKTFVAGAVARAVNDAAAGHLAVCAPTGKAAVRVTEAMRRYGVSKTATTIHRLLGVTRGGHDGRGWGFMFNDKNPLPVNFLIIDEVSMLDVDLAASLFKALRPGTHVILVGDPYQLPPVSHGAVLRDLMAAGVPHGLFTEIRRQADEPGNMIIEGCQAVKGGTVPQMLPWDGRLEGLAGVKDGKNLLIIPADSAEQIADGVRVAVEVLAGVVSHNSLDPIDHVQVICPRNEDTPASRVPLNQSLQFLLNEEGLAQEGRQVPFKIGDKIICLKNGYQTVCSHVDDADEDTLAACRRTIINGPRYDADSYVACHEKPTPDSGTQEVEAFLANGEQGRIVAVATWGFVADFTLPDRRVLVRQRARTRNEESGDNGDEGKGNGCNFDLAYAVTIHKGQGSEWPIVVVAIDPAAGELGARELIYTAISRASQLCVLVGRTETLAKWARRQVLPSRKTWLAKLLAGITKRETVVV
jgi:exodeoxyribonuclease V alpha subunit